MSVGSSISNTQNSTGIMQNLTGIMQNLTGISKNPNLYNEWRIHIMNIFIISLVALIIVIISSGIKLFRRANIVNIYFVTTQSLDKVKDNNDKEVLTNYTNNLL